MRIARFKETPVATVVNDYETDWVRILRLQFWEFELEFPASLFNITKIDATWNTTYPVRTETWLPTYWFWFLPADASTLTYSYN